MNEINSTLPAKIGGTEITRFNALRHGVLSRYSGPWLALRPPHNPNGDSHAKRPSGAHPER